MTSHIPSLGLDPASLEPGAMPRSGGVACDDTDERPTGRAMLRGWRRRCPCCGAGPLLRGYLKVRDSCAVCGTELYHHRADDGPAYLTILIVGHVMAPILLWSFIKYRPDPLVMAAVLCIGTVALSLYLLPRLKGVIVGVQWARRMHGFGQGDA